MATSHFWPVESAPASAVRCAWADRDASREASPDDPDGCVVATAPLSRILAEFVSGWRKGRPSVRNRFDGDRTAVEPVGPYQWLAQDTGLPEHTIRAVRNPKRQPVTELRVADALVASIGAPGMFYDGTLTVMPNPRAAPGRRAECCGGSDRPAS